MTNDSLRTLTFAEAIREALHLALERDPDVYVLGLGVPDPVGIFGTTLGLQERFGDARVLDMPTAENGMTGVALGSAIAGMRPVMSHVRLDFALLALDQIVNQAAKWHYMFDGRMRAPMVIRMLVGRGWGQGPQHSQSLHSWFAHVPGLKVVAPATPADAKGLMLSSIEDDAPVIFFEHRWLHSLRGHVPEGYETVPLGRARVAREGADLTIVANSHMTIEALRAAGLAAEAGISLEVVDLRSLRPLDTPTVIESVRKTGHALVLDGSWRTGGFAGELSAVIVEEAFDALQSAPQRLTLPDVPVPTSPALSQLSYPRAKDIAALAATMLGAEEALSGVAPLPEPEHLDVPDPAFTGPF